MTNESVYGRLLVLTCVVASTLMASGYTAQESVNPFDPARPAWLFTVSPELAHDAKQAYEACGKRVPPYLVRLIERLEREQSAGEGGAAI